MLCIDTIRKMPLFFNLPLLFFVENAPGNIGEQVYQVLVKHNVQNYFLPRDSGTSKEPRMGITPSATLKNDMTTRLIALVRDRAVGFSSHFAAGPGDIDRGASGLYDRLGAVPTMKEKICRQAACWELVSQVSTQGRVSIRWTGKRAGNDDVFVALLYSIYGLVEFYQTTTKLEYVRFRRQINNRTL